MPVAAGSSCHDRRHRNRYRNPNCKPRINNAADLRHYRISKKEFDTSRATVHLGLMLTVRNIAPTPPTPPEMVVAPLASAGGEVGVYGAMLFDDKVSESPATQGW
jgi:hypothetical protein